MPKLKNYSSGKRVNIWLPERSLKIADDIENLSKFFQIALEQAAGIMALDIIKKQRGFVQPLPTKEEIARFNADNPLNPLTAKRTNTKQWPSTPPSQKKQELW